MGVRIEWSIRAVRQLLRFERRDQRRIHKAVAKLSGFPATANVRHLANDDPPYRLRAGNHRVLFSFDGVQRLISIEDVRKRDEHTY